MPFHPMQKTRSAMLVDLPAAFAHVVAVHRAFATALADSEFYGMPTSTTQLTEPVSGGVPRELGTVFRDSLLMNGRNLIDFYSRKRTGRVFDADILVRDFSLQQPANAKTMRRAYVQSISAHVVHITAWRDVALRSKHHVPDRAWIDWDVQTGPFGDELLAALLHVAQQGQPWSVMFRRLHDACLDRRADPTVDWPPDLATPPAIAALASSHNL